MFDSTIHTKPCVHQQSRQHLQTTHSELHDKPTNFSHRKFLLTQLKVALKSIKQEKIIIFDHIIMPDFSNECEDKNVVLTTSVRPETILFITKCIIVLKQFCQPEIEYPTQARI